MKKLQTLQVFFSVLMDMIGAVDGCDYFIQQLKKGSGIFFGGCIWMMYRGAVGWTVVDRDDVEWNGSFSRRVQQAGEHQYQW